MVASLTPVPAGSEAPAPVNILLVDDQPGRLLTYRAILEPLGECLVQASSGREALKLLMEDEYALILLVYLWALGGLIGLWTRTGGAIVFAEWAGSRIVRGPNSARFFAWLMGIVFHQGGTISTILGRIDGAIDSSRVLTLPYGSTTATAW